MNNEKAKPAGSKGPAASGQTASKSGPPGPIVPVKTQPLFRKTDWLTFLITFATVWIGYYLTLAPEQTLEDSGELATGSFYAGIPHPPGYPVWTIYTWLWTELLPFKNIAWRVALGEATSGALAAGLLALLVSRGSSLLIEGIEDLKSMSGQWESSICMVSGFVAGALIGFNGFMWSQSVIVEVYAFSVASLMLVMLCLLRWIYAPHQHRYLYYALFFHGVCFTNHMTLVVAAMGIEIAIAAANYRMGRYLFLGNSIIYICGLILKSEHILTSFEQNPAVFAIFNVVGIGSIATYLWFTVLSRETFPEFCMDACLAVACIVISGVPRFGFVCVIGGLACLAGAAKFLLDTRKLGWEMLVVVACGFCWIAGALFYFYMPVAGMTNPPMEWGYPRTVEGFIHAFTRGQYEKTNPTDIIHHPGTFITQLGMMWDGVVEEFNWLYALLALIPFLFFKKLHRRERAWMIGVTAIYLCLGVLLLILLNPPPDKQAQGLVRVFFTASHTMISLLIGYGLTLVAAYMATHYQRFRYWGLIGGGVAIALALFSFAKLNTEVYFGPAARIDLAGLLSIVGKAFTNKDQYGLPVFSGLLLIGMTVLFVAALFIYKNRAPLLITLGIFALMPLYSVMTHWSDNEQHNHWFGYWFGHDMFTPPFNGSDGKPLYPQMTKDAVLFGGTDPGRFCPTYMIFCDSFLPRKCQPEQDKDFDRRDVRLITQNALADGTYLNYIRAQYNRSTQIDPPFFQEFARFVLHDSEYETNLVARMVRPLDDIFEGLGDRIEKRRRTFTSWFTDTEFTDASGFAGKLRAQGDPLSKYLYENLSPKTQQLLSGNDPKALVIGLCDDLNTLIDRELAVKKQIAEKKAELDEAIGSGKTARQQELEKQIAELSKIEPLYNPERFNHVQISEYLQDFIKENPKSHTRVRLNRLLLEAAYPKEIVHSKGGVYPDREIYTPTPDDSQRCFQDYLQDAQRRLQLNQLKPGEDVKVIENRVQVSGQVAVMSINGLLTKVIFDHNPKSEFFVEESFPLDWMYPYLSPFGIIMKINRQPLPELTEEIVRRDHEFWSQFSDRLIGNWVTYDTTVKEIAAFVEKVYLRRDFSGFKGDRKFIRDDQAQKAFSKLRSSIGGVYNWRISDPNNRNTAVQQRMVKEADFAFRQAFAFCPYSPEAVFRYANLLLSMQRFDDALTVAETCLKIDPYNGQVLDLVTRLREWKRTSGGAAGGSPLQPNLAQLEKAVQENPSNYQAAFNLASAYLAMQQNNRAIEVLDRVMNDPHVEVPALRALTTAYSSIGSTASLQKITEKLEKLAQGSSNSVDAPLALAEAYHAQQKNDLANQTLDQAFAHSNIDANVILQFAQQYAALANYPKLEGSLERLTKVVPTAPEAWYDLAAVRASLGNSTGALPALRQALTLSAERKAKDPKSADLTAQVEKDGRFAAVRQLPEYKQITTKK